MLTSLFGRCIGLWTVVCVLLLFFFPLAHGNFQSTHGPVTALRAKRSLAILFFAMIMAALQLFAVRVHRALIANCRRVGRFGRFSELPGLVTCDSVLRC